MNPAVQEHVATGRTVQHIVVNQHAAVHGPGRFQLLPSHHATVHGCPAESPGQRSVLGIQSVDVTVGRTEQHKSLIVRRRRIDAAAGGERPSHLAGLGIQRDDLVRIYRGDKHLAGGDGGGAQATADLGLPHLADTVRRNSDRTGAAASRIVTVGWPVIRICDFRFAISDLAEGWALLQPLARGDAVLPRLRHRAGGQCLEAG